MQVCTNRAGELSSRIRDKKKPYLSLWSARIHGNHNSYLPGKHRQKLNVQRYTFKLKHQPGKDNPTNFLSRHPSQIPDTREQKEQQHTQLINHHVNAIIRDDLSAAETLEQMTMATEHRSTKQRLIQDIQTGYISNPDKLLLPYTHVFKKFSTAEGLALSGSKMVVPESPRK